MSLLTDNGLAKYLTEADTDNPDNANEIDGSLAKYLED